MQLELRTIGLSWESLRLLRKDGSKLEITDCLGKVKFPHPVLDLQTQHLRGRGLNTCVLKQGAEVIFMNSEVGKALSDPFLLGEGGGSREVMSQPQALQHMDG